MTGAALFVFILIGLAAALMASNRVRFDIIALLVVLALMFSGILTPAQSLSGFGSTVVILVAGLLIIGEMLDRTGVARAMGDLILEHGAGSEAKLIVFLMLGAAVLSSVMSSTAVVAIFIPIVLRIAAETRISPSRLFIPMSYAALISGMLTLIATTPNIVISEELERAGLKGFGFFTFSPVGLVVLAVAIAYILLIGRRMLRSDAGGESADGGGRPITALLEDFQVASHMEAVRVGADSPLVGQTLGEVEFETHHGARVIGVERLARRGEDRILCATSAIEVRAGDVLLLINDPDAPEVAPEALGLSEVIPSERRRAEWLQELGAASVLVHPESTLVGKSLRESALRSRFGVHVLGVRRSKEPIDDYLDAKLRVADNLLITGAWRRIDELRSHPREFIVTEMPRERADVIQEYRKMPVALGILAVMVVLSLLNLLPLVGVVVGSALAAIFTRCLTMEDAYRSIHWSSIVLVAGMLPLAQALEVTGGIDVIVDGVLAIGGDAGPRVALTLMFFVTAAMSLFLSNTAAAVLVAPIAILVSREMNVSPYPIAIAVVIAASSGYATPVSSPIVTLVVEPGRYRFMDFVKVGTPLLLLTYVVTLVITPLVFPFDGFEWPADPAAEITETIVNDGGPGKEP